MTCSLVRYRQCILRRIEKRRMKGRGNREDGKGKRKQKMKNERENKALVTTLKRKEDLQNPSKGFVDF